MINPFVDGGRSLLAAVIIISLYIETLERQPLYISQKGIASATSYLRAWIWNRMMRF